MGVMVKDYYTILLITQSASRQEIRTAYRRLAKEYHPDLNPIDPELAEEMFRDISEAYEILSDPERRRIYDESGYQEVLKTFKKEKFTWEDFTHQDELCDLVEDARRAVSRYTITCKCGRVIRIASPRSIVRRCPRCRKRFIVQFERRVSGESCVLVPAGVRFL